MIARVTLPMNTDESFDSILIECDRINYTESKETWRAHLLRGGDEVAMFQVHMQNENESKTKIYIMEAGKVVDRLPRR